MSNALAGARSPFLRHGAEQPVNWQPFGDIAFEQAVRTGKPILLDIGAIWCHWCHVMDRESYEDADTAALINELFVPVKVDRDERPDVDARYQRAVQILVGQGGWPLTAFLTPEGDVFYGGTYFPPTDQHGRPSFKRVLGEIARVWRDDRARATESARDIRDRLAAHARAEAQPGEPDPQLIEHTIEEFAHSFDFRFGGFGRAPKFPNTGGLALLLDHDLDRNVEWSRRMVLETLLAMARGGIYDQLGGGFHRYSVDARWIIPHFEKMSYDNGPLLEVYARAAAAYGDAELSRAAQGVVDHYFDIARPLLERGGFPASQDADYSPHDDGDYWTWTADEMGAALNDQDLTAAASLHWGLDEPASSMHLDPERHVLFRAQPIAELARQLEVSESIAAERIERARARLKSVRDQRPQPFVDETVYSGWCALVASGFIAAARHLGLARARAPALRALDQVWAAAFDPAAGLAHRVGDREAGEYFEDQAHFAQALLDAYELSQDEMYLARARELVDVVESRFLDAGSGAYRDRASGAAAPASALAEPTLSVADSPVPSGNGAFALVLLRLAALTHDEQYKIRAHRVLRAFAGSAARLASSAATYMRALYWATWPVTQVVVVTAAAPADDDLLNTALRPYRPRTVVRRFEPNAVDRDALPPELQAMVTAQAPRAYVCIGQSCLPPFTGADELAAALRRRVYPLQ